jgi:polysaccharide export outer membrane protein
MQFQPRIAAAFVLGAMIVVPVYAQQPTPNASAEAPATTSASLPLPAGYLIGADDLLSIVFWRDKDMSADVVVRPDGRISLPLLNDVQAAGLTPDQLRIRMRRSS